MGFSTIGTGTGGGGGGSAQQVNFSVTASTSQTISALYIANSIVDVAGLLVAVQNTGGSAITLTAASGSIVNTASYPVNSTGTTVVIQPNATVVLETNLANLQYFINSYSNITNILGGTAGQLVWQSAANTTGFIPTGTANYMLQSNGTSVPTWVPVAVPNVQGGAAGEVLYQAATNLTNFVSPGTSGQILVSNGTAAPSWATIAAGSGVTVNNTGTTITISGTRSYTFLTTAMTNNQSFVTFLSTGGVTDVDGNQYTIYNNTSSAFTVNFPTLVNYQSYNFANGYFISSNTNIILQPNCSINIQTYTAGSSYSIMDASQSQAWGFQAQIVSQGALPSSTDTTMNFTAVSNPTGAFNNTSHAFVVPKAGIWIFTAQNAFGATATTYNCNIQILRNGSSVGIAFNQNSAQTASQALMQKLSIGLECSVGDSIIVTNWISAGGIGVGTGSQTTFSAVLCK